MTDLRFHEALLKKKPPSGLNVETTLAHFAIITYMVDPKVLRPHVHERFSLDLIEDRDGTPKALVSVVPFLDLDFRFARFPWPKFRFGQTNYRAYITDSRTGDHVAWFFGTSLDTIAVAVPRHLWKLPWHKATIHFDVEYSADNARFTKYRMRAESKWAPANVELKDTGLPPKDFIGFDDLESGLVLLTHPTKGFFYRRDGKLGTYSIWHDRLQPTVGHASSASFPLLERLGLIEDGALSSIHSVLMQPRTEFTIYLPPKKLK